MNMWVVRRVHYFSKWLRSHLYRRRRRRRRRRLYLPRTMHHHHHHLYLSRTMDQLIQ